MKDFAALYAALDGTTSSNAKLAALVAYFAHAEAADAAWAVYFLAGGRPKQLLPTRVLREAAVRASGLPLWLFEESYQAVGDLAETISLLLPLSPQADAAALSVWLEQRLLPLRRLAPELQQERLLTLLHGLDRPSVMLCVKLITGAFRVGVSRLLVTKALAAVSGVDAKRIAQRMVGYTDLAAQPAASDYLRLVAPADDGAPDDRDLGQPYPFFLAHPLTLTPEDFPAQLGPVTDWIAEWKWDGIRAQLVRRGAQLWLWSRGEELITERFPEFAPLRLGLPDGCVIDGEIVVWQGGQVQPFALLQHRIGRKNLSAASLHKAPVVLLAYDLLEWQGEDLRSQPQSARRQLLEQVVLAAASPVLQLSAMVAAESWAALAQAREASRSQAVEGLMLKARSAQYGVGRTKDVGVWWKWKIDPYQVDAVLIYAQRGHGRRASVYSDFTFAVWDAGPEAAERKLLPFAKAYSGLTDAEMQAVDAVIRRTTIDKFGPVRSVTPTMVFELGFEGIAESPRHKSGIAVRFPRILRWRRDKPIAEADTLASLRALLPPQTAAAPATKRKAKN